MSQLNLSGPEKQAVCTGVGRGRVGAAIEVECLQRKLHLQINIAVEKLSV